MYCSRSSSNAATSAERFPMEQLLQVNYWPTLNREGQLSNCFFVQMLRKVPSKQSDQPGLRGQQEQMKGGKQRSWLFILSLGDLIAIPKMNVAVGTGWRVCWQLLQMWGGKKGFAAIFLCGERGWVVEDQVRNSYKYKRHLYTSLDLGIAKDLPRIMNHLLCQDQI